jgi:hypothetical protein
MFILRDAFHILIFLLLAFAVVLFVLGIGTSFSRVAERWDRRSSLFSQRRPLPSEFSSEYYASYRRSLWLGGMFTATVAIVALLLWLDTQIFGPAN